MKVSVATPARHTTELDRDVASAYVALHNACLAQAHKAATNGDVFTVYRWMQRAIAAQGMVNRVEQGRGHI